MLSAVLSATLLAAPPMSFGFTNAEGTQLLALGEVGAPRSLTRAVCGGRLLRATFVEQQRPGPRDTGRQTARNFTQAGGARFTLTGGTAPADSVCLLGSDAVLAKRQRFSVVAGPEACDAQTNARAEALGGRPVARCTAAGRVRDGQLALVHFRPRDQELLVALLFTDAKGVSAVRLFPATKGAAAQPSCWRADDGCEFDVASYRVTFAMAGREGLELFALWDGAEGQTAEVLRVKGETLEVIASASRYWAPE
jgi:hypothetical protein